jgi:hypothetical protein
MEADGELEGVPLAVIEVDAVLVAVTVPLGVPLKLGNVLTCSSTRIMWRP